MKLIHTLLILLLLILFSSCYKCEQQQTATLRFTNDELKINPYSGNELLIFKDINGDSIAFPKGVRDTRNMRIYQYDYEAAKFDHHGCQGDYFDSDINGL